MVGVERERIEKMRYCKVCGEEIPPYVRLCSCCLYIKYYSYECRCHLTPMPYLNIMRGYTFEAQQLPMPNLLGARNEVVEHEIADSFEMVRFIVECSFGRDKSVMEAIALMEDILYDELTLRREVARRRRLIAVVSISVVMLSTILTLLSLST